MVQNGLNDAFLLLGSNLGDVRQNMIDAQKKITESIGPIVTKSSIYKTAPWGITNQPEFLNQVVLVNTSLDPTALLSKAMSIEHEMGRLRKEKWQARIIDLDILFYNDEIINEKNLTIPHPGIPVRRFTLKPLVEIAPDYIHPVYLRKLSDLLNECDDQSPVTQTDL
ncbi:MAG TPA: 2-amino-4-hydroxy-6-hydroxymethyldihydropteridine diphosphokinase [Cyclobacteriaceae bacterium]|nr:2-amino-4-hydroxy-6-hydroxymethyldihydropteridine diphosphokinase [Cyclobacteriaceae bacterium]